MKIQIGLFFGGNSVEHEVSVISALQAFGRFDREKYDVLPIYISRNSEFYTGEAAGRIEEYRDLKALTAKCTQVFPVRLGDRAALLEQGAFGWKKKPYAVLDVAFPVVHGTNVEDGALQGFFRTLGIPFAGCDVAASALGMDKYAQKLLYRSAGLPVLSALRLGAEDDREAFCPRAEEQMGYPMIVKPLDLGSSVGIRLAHDRAELLEALAPYISARALARICGMSESQMLQYKAGLKQISPRNIARINEKLRTFAAELSAMSLKGA